MSYVIAVPETLMAAASDVADIGSSLSQANSAATASTTALVPAAEDEVSAAIASLFYPATARRFKRWVLRRRRFMPSSCKR